MYPICQEFNCGNSTLKSGNLFYISLCRCIKLPFLQKFPIELATFLIPAQRAKKIKLSDTLVVTRSLHQLFKPLLDV